MSLDHDKPTRRQVLQGGAFVAASVLLPGGNHLTRAATEAPSPRIDRRMLVSRHNVRRSKSNLRTPLQVGNGSIALGADITGLQTFVPFNILSQWAWFSQPMRAGTSAGQMKDVPWKSRSREVPYDTGDPSHPYVTRWIYSNPSRMNLGRIGLTLLRSDGRRAGESDLTDLSQELDLWTGTLKSRFTLDGQPVTVTTACHPEQDLFAVKVQSPAAVSGRVSAYVDFPVPDDREFADHVGTFIHAAQYPMKVAHRGSTRVDLHRDLGSGEVNVAIAWENGVSLRRRGEGDDQPPKVNIISARYGTDKDWADVAPVVTDLVRRGEAELVADTPTLKQDPAPYRVKRLEITYTVDGLEYSQTIPEHDRWTISEVGGPDRVRLTAAGDTLAFVVAFAPGPLAPILPSAGETIAAAANDWPRFWMSGGAIDLSDSTDPRWNELERRIVLSQYLMKINEAGDWPPQESGLVNNGWFGKFHMEMYWWHAAHYALWNRWALLDRSSSIYSRMLADARARAKRQGYKGARWTKMTGPEFRNSAYITNALLAWQQPHPMFFAELEYRARPSRQTLAKWREVLSEAADFMASYADLNPATGLYDLGPPIAVVAENTDDRITTNPAFELSYWRFGLRIAQTWRQRLGLRRDPDWDRVLNNLAPLPAENNVYVSYENIPNMWTNYNRGHPALIGALGWLPGDGVDPAVMRSTLEQVLAKWNMENDVWGWDFPMLAMCAARLGNPEKAVDLILTSSDRFAFDDAGLATGGPYPYFPSNGGLLYAVAMMAAGWDGAPEGKAAPGFPSNGKWVVKFEKLSRAV